MCGRHADRKSRILQSGAEHHLFYSNVSYWPIAGRAAIASVAVIPRKFPKEQATQGSGPSGQTPDPASQGDEAETHKKN